MLIVKHQIEHKEHNIEQLYCNIKFDNNSFILVFIFWFIFHIELGRCFKLL